MSKIAAERALAEAWASIDGRLESFRECEHDKEKEDERGHFLGYLADAHEMINRLNSRGFNVTPLKS